MSTDLAWEEWGRRDPYFGVITDPKYRRSKLDEQARTEFFESGRRHVDYVMKMIHTYIDPGFRPTSVVDFGCGAGRLVVPFGRVAQQVVGLDVSPSMLNEARRNCAFFHLSNVRLLLSDDELSGLTGEYDLVHSFIVFQHIPPERGRVILRRLLDFIAPGGMGAIHVLYGKRINAETYGMPPQKSGNGLRSLIKPILTPDADPEMQMNPYLLNEFLFLLQSAGVHRLHIEYTDHGGELGVFMFFRKMP